ncbi:LysR family transcriptional regulator [Heliomarina baculiformis]|uniref:helix-turn-helix domain-containing protein n=1 Tax=Heliomarina baculiformis TaxID=2872036 RepID=UPI003080282E
MRCGIADFRIIAIDKFTDFDAVLAISRRGSFRAAALDLGMSTSALSNAIAKLEEHLGLRLFNRTIRSVSLTGAGAGS